MEIQQQDIIDIKKIFLKILQWKRQFCIVGAITAVASYMLIIVAPRYYQTEAKLAPGCEIVVPTKHRGNRLSTAEILTIGTSTASIATMIATLVNILK